MIRNVTIKTVRLPYACIYRFGHAGRNPVDVEGVRLILDYITALEN